MGIFHQFLRWLPAGLGGAVGVVLAIAATWDAAKNWIGVQAAYWWSHMSDPLVGGALLAGIVAYVADLIVTAEKKEGPKLKGSIDQFIGNPRGPENAHPGLPKDS